MVIDQNDSILCIINDIIKPFKKKNLNYLIKQHKNIILFKDIHTINKCNKCQNFKPWLIVQNEARGIFLIKKIIDFFKPWVTLYLQKTIYQLNFSNDSIYDSLFVLYTKINDGSLVKIYNYYLKNKKLFIDQDVRIKNFCKKKDNECTKFYLWAILQNSFKSYKLIEEMNDIFKPWLIFKLQKIIYLHNFPQEFLELSKWSKKEERNLGNLKVVIQN